MTQNQFIQHLKKQGYTNEQIRNKVEESLKKHLNLNNYDKIRELITLSGMQISEATVKEKYQEYFRSNDNKSIKKLAEVSNYNLKLSNSYLADEVDGLLSAMKKFKVKTGYIVTTNQTENFEVNGLNVLILKEKEFRKKFGINSE